MTTNINTLDEANDAVNNGRLIKVETSRTSAKRTHYFTASEDGWQKGYQSAAGTLTHEVVTVDEVRSSIKTNIEDDGASVTAVRFEDSPWGRDRSPGIAI